MSRRNTWTALTSALAASAVLAAVQPTFAGEIRSPLVERPAADRLVVTWSDSDPVDVYLADGPDQPLAQARRLAQADRDGRLETPAPADARPFFILRDTASGEQTPVAERLIPLEQGSNFRDIGGYPAAGGRHVRWGRIYRSGATPLLTDADVRELQGLVTEMVDLRSSEERSLAPTRLDGVSYSAVGYSWSHIMASSSPKTLPSAEAIYRGFPTLLAPQLKIIFAKLLAGQGPLVYNCSAGQDRTGFATAMILSALGAPREVIVQDYLLSTADRRPQYEMPKLDPAAQAGNPVGAFFAQVQQNPAAAAPRPLYDAGHRAFLEASFDEIDARWGSVDNYLAKVVGVSPAEIERLRAMYLQ
jgi:protein-tyrosine phosphatase